MTQDELCERVRPTPRLGQQKINRDAFRTRLENAIQQPAELVGLGGQRCRISRKRRVIDNDEEDAAVRRANRRRGKPHIQDAAFDPLHQVRLGEPRGEQTDAEREDG